MSLQVFYRKEKDMKKFLMGAAAVLLALGGLLTGCTNGDDDDGTSDVGTEKIPTSISVNTSGAQTTFTIGTTFSAEGLVVRAHYEDDPSREVSLSNCTFKIGNKELTSGATKLDADVLGTPNNDTNGTYTVTVSYKEKEDSYDITIVTEVVLARIAVDVSKAMTTFTVGNTFSAEGLVVTAYYSDGIKKQTVDVSECTFKIGNNALTSGATELTEELLGTPNAGTDDTYTVTVSCERDGVTETTTYTITVRSKSNSVPDENGIEYYALETTAAAESDLSNLFKVIDCDAAGDANVHDNYNASRAKIVWGNPLNGKTLSSGATFVFDVYSDKGENFDAAITVCKAAANGSPTDFEALALFEGGAVRYIKAPAADNTWDNAGSGFADVPAQINKAWTKVAVVIGTDGSVFVYRNGVKSTITTTESGYTWAAMNTFLTSSADAIGIDIGFSAWKSGYLIDKTYLSEDIRVYPIALTEAQVQKVYKETFKPTAKTLTISEPLTTFQAGETLTLGDATVNVTDSYGSVFSIDASKVTLSAKIKGGTTTVSAGEVLPIGTYTVTATYTATERDVFTGNATATYDITVTSAISSIALKSNSKLYSYSADGETYYVFGKSAAIIEVVYTNGTSDEMKADVLTFKTVTEKSVTVEYAGKETTLELIPVAGIDELIPVAGIDELIPVAGDVYYTAAITGSGYSGDTHKMNVGFARDAGIEYTILGATLNGTAFVTESQTVSIGFINDPLGCSVHTTTEGGDFTIYALADFTAVSCSEVFGPWNIVIGDIDNPGNFGWVIRPDYFGFDPLPSYTLKAEDVVYTGQSNWYPDEQSELRGHNYDGKYVIFKITGTTTTVKTEVYILSK